MIGLSVFLMVPVASMFTGLFLEDVAAAVEARHYPTCRRCSG
jgi:CysZ protein